MLLPVCSFHDGGDGRSLVWRNIESAASCLEGEGADTFENDALAAVVEEGTGFNRVELLLFLKRFAVRADLSTAIEDFDFGFLVAVGLSLCVNDSIMCCHCHSPANGGGAKMRAGFKITRETCHPAATPHRAGDRPRRSVGRYTSRCLHLRKCCRLRCRPPPWHARGFAQSGVNFSQQNTDRWPDRGAVHRTSLAKVPPHTLCALRKSSRF
jgi:hypothetical protein